MTFFCRPQNPNRPRPLEEDCRDPSIGPVPTSQRTRARVGDVAADDDDDDARRCCASAIVPSSHHRPSMLSGLRPRQASFPARFVPHRPPRGVLAEGWEWANLARWLVEELESARRERRLAAKPHDESACRNRRAIRAQAGHHSRPAVRMPRVDDRRDLERFARSARFVPRLTAKVASAIRSALNGSASRSIRCACRPSCTR